MDEKVEAVFTDEFGGSFKGSLEELIREIYRRSAILGSTSYRLILKPTILLPVEGK